MVATTPINARNLRPISGSDAIIRPAPSAEKPGPPQPPTSSAVGSTQQLIMFVGGHRTNADPAASITGFSQRFPGAHAVSAGPLGGEAVSVQQYAGSKAAAICAWSDNDSFGESRLH